MSPEQCRGQKVDHRTDVYSFGIVAYQLLTGRVPFSGESYMDVMMRHASEAPARLSELCPDLPADLDLAVRRMLEKSPEKRPSSVGEALEALARAAQSAGFAVDVRPVRSGSGVSALTPAPGYTPANLHSLASAETIQAPSTGGTLENVATSAAPPSKARSRKVYAVLAALLVAGGALGALALSRSRSHAKRPVAAATTEAPAPAPAPKPAEPRAGNVTIKPTPAKNVQLRVRSRPRDADVYLNGEKIATTPDVVKVPRGEQAVELEFRARGFLPEKVKVTPNEDSLVEARLKPERVARPRRAGTGTPPGDLEF
jgi:serine/threonine-protein kinase